MPDTQKKYDALAADLAEQPNVVRAKMFGMPSVRVNGNAFLGYFRGDLVCKLSGDVHAAALKLKGAHLFDPSEMNRQQSPRFFPLGIVSPTPQPDGDKLAVQRSPVPLPVPASAPRYSCSRKTRAEPPANNSVFLLARLTGDIPETSALSIAKHPEPSSGRSGRALRPST